MKKILYIVPNLYIASGVSKIVMNYYNFINKQENQIDFLVMDKKEQSYEQKLTNSGSKVFYLENKFSILNINKIKDEFYKFLQKNYYDIIELHAPTFSFIFLKVSKKYGTPIRIVHSHSTTHSTNKVKNLLSIILNINLKKYANRFFACSEKSGLYWYGRKICNSNKYKLIKNGLDTEVYNFDKEVREKLRKEYNLNGKIVIGFVGRISKDKNLSFFIKVIKKIIKENSKYVFLVVGDGKELRKMKIQCKEIQNNVIFLGNRKDVNRQLNCMDLLVLPSKREGLPMVALEAQLTGLPCYLSNTITKEVDIGNTKFLKLNKNEWIRELKKFSKKNNITIDRNKFDIKTCSKELEDIYDEYIKEIGEI